MTIPLILASVSPRRRELLRLLGLSAEVVPADLDESWKPGELPHDHAERLARAKVAAIASRRPEAAVVGADTIVVVDGDILGKPADAVEAREMLRRLAGRDHDVFTAVAVSWRGAVASAVERTRVWVRSLDDDAIAAYVATGEPLDKAGAYGIQGYGAVLVERIDGDYFTVVGLGLVRLVKLLESVGLAYRFDGLVAAS